MVEAEGKRIVRVAVTLQDDKRSGGELYKVRWEKGDERAVLTSQSEKRQGVFSVSRGDFEEEIYRVR